MAQTADDRRIEVFRRKYYGSRAPDLNTVPRVSSRRLEIAQPVERGCQSGAGSNLYRRVFLFCGQREPPFPILISTGTFSRNEPIPQLPLKCQTVDPGWVKN